MKIYNKLVRDKIPDIIKEEGRNVKTKVLNENEYIEELNKKLQEEVSEYLKDNNVEELVDIVQFIYSLLDVRKFSMEKFENMRQQKNINNGAFKERLFLIEAD